MLPRMSYCVVGCCLFSVITATTLSAAEPTSDELVQMIIKLIGDSDREFRAAGLEQVRTAAKGAAATQLFAGQLTKLDPAGQVALLSALSDRGDTLARTAVLELFSSSKEDRVRAAAITAIGSLGNTSDLPLLIKTLTAGSALEQTAARQSLVRLPGGTVSKMLGTESTSAVPELRSKLIDILAIRRATPEIPVMLSAAVDENSQVRSAAMTALGQLGRPEDISQMLAGVLKAPRGSERDSAERNTAQVCARIDNEDQRGAKLIDEMAKVPVADRDELLPLVGRVGGKTLVNFVAEIALGNDVARRSLAIDALSKWPDASVADKLLEIVNKTTDPNERKQAFQGYIKVSASRDNRSDKQRLDRMKEAMNVAKTPEEQTLVINRTRTAYDVESVRFVLPYVDQPQFTEIACETIVEIAHHREVRDHHKPEFDKILDKVIEVTKDPVIVDRAQRYKRGETWERPKK